MLTFLVVFLILAIGTQQALARPFVPANDMDNSRFQGSFEYAKRLRVIELDIEELKLLEFMNSVEIYIDKNACLNDLKELNNVSNQRRQKIKQDYEQYFNREVQALVYTP